MKRGVLARSKDTNWAGGYEEALKSLGLNVPPRLVAGRVNPNHYVALLGGLNALMFKSIAAGGAIPFNLESAAKMIYRQAELDGIKESALVDNRSEADKALEVLRNITDDPAGVFELCDQQIYALELTMDRIDELMIEVVAEEAEIVEGENGLGKPMMRRTDKVRRVLKRLKDVRKRVLSEEAGKDFRGTVAVKAGRLLRFMAYVGRSGLPEEELAREAKKSGGSPINTETFFRFGKHHALMALDLYMARTRRKMRPDMGLTEERYPYIGAMLVCPPRHGKTELGTYFFALEFCKNPRHQLVIVHAQAGLAKQNLQHLSRNFSKNETQGRRLLSLWPELELESYDNNAGMMRFKVKGTIGQPSAKAFGVDARASGSTATMLWFDDPVDQASISSETERNATFERINGTWMRRLSGQYPFVLTTTTLWHPEDANMKRIRQVAKGLVWMRVRVMRCGGPKDSTPFKPLWPEMYPAWKLRSFFEEMANPVLYSAAYMSNPISDEKRVIKKIRYYDVDSPDHADFVASSVKHLSLDPAATRTSKSDKASGLYAAVGMVQMKRGTGTESERVESEMRIRVLDAFQMHATQTELVDKAMEYAISRPVDYIHVETVTGFVGVAEMFSGKGLDVITHTTRSKSKEERLRAAAPLIEDGHASMGVRAVVEFPAKKKSEYGEMVPEQGLTWLFEQVLQFGATSEDHGVDALTQLVNYLAPSMMIGRGGIASQIARQNNEDENRVARHFRALAEMSENRLDSVEEEDAKWAMNQWR